MTDADLQAEVEASPDGQVSLTDPDARAMATSGRGSGIVGKQYRCSTFRTWQPGSLPRCRAVLATQEAVPPAASDRRHHGSSAPAASIRGLTCERQKKTRIIIQ